MSEKFLAKALHDAKLWLYWNLPQVVVLAVVLAIPLLIFVLVHGGVVRQDACEAAGGVYVDQGFSGWYCAGPDGNPISIK